MKLRTLLLATTFLAAVGCDTDPGKGKAQAKVADALEETTPKVQASEHKTNLVKYSIGPSNSSVGFVGAKLTDSHDGRFDTFNGSLELVQSDPTKSSFSIEIQMASLQLQPLKLAGHLKAPDFFDIGKFPTAKFATTSLEKAKQANEFTVTGNLTMRGVKKSITFPATIIVGKNTLKVDAEFAINRKNFGIVYAGMADDLIKDNVLIKIKLNPKKS